MAGLVSDAELAALGEVVELGMQTPVSLLRYELVARGDDDPQRVWTETATTVGWLWEPPEFPSGGDVGGVVGTSNAHLLRLPLGTDARAGDRIGVDGDLFEVLDDNSSDTYQTYLRLSLRRVE
jgi:hypothetical protein